MRKFLLALVVLTIAVAAGCTSDAANNKGAACGKKCGASACGAKCGAKACATKCGCGSTSNANAEYPNVVIVAYHADS